MVTSAAVPAVVGTAKIGMDLFFVSATRARDELYVVAQRYAYGSKGNGKSIPDTRVQNIFLREAVWAVEQK